ncbi:cupin domain-containing protein [Mycolicibacterium sp. CBMA 226]|uniref:cupin domain-containing protein n=1 Tax=Mycolicibacterium sp. CBMA 226 TaxID=2606611 RepID=UPI0012DCAF91|nr:cupin domain-containing protein [Mycolicibacterium sp. CBMA 226]MUL74518.1 cupin domain-containing protein [Mycolicibacterium sp. CBMA 226]
MAARLVLTGFDDAGRSVVVHDAGVDAVAMPGAGHLYPFWSANEPATYPSDGLSPKAPEFFPPLNGSRFFTMVLTPQEGAASVQDTDGEKLGADLAAAMDHDNPGMHATDTTDFAIVTQGSVGLELDEGAEVILHAGDAVVQNGTRHKWRVVGDTEAVITFVLIGAHRTP